MHQYYSRQVSQVNFKGKVMNHTPGILALSFAAMTAAMPASAANGPSVTTGGFGTAALTMTDSSEAEFSRPNQAAGAKKTPRTGVDSNFGFQATAKFNDWLSVSGQGLVRKNATDAFGAELNAAYVKLKASDELTFRIGRVGLPIYLVSDFRYVGYANTMLRPPTEMYRQVAADSIDGADMVYQRNIGDTTLTTQFGVGRTTVPTLNGVKNEFKWVTSLHVVAEHGPFTLRLGRTDAVVSAVGNAQLDGVQSMLRANGFQHAAEQLKIADIRASFTALGLIVDWKNTILQAEYAVRRTDSLLIHDTSSWYAMAGHRFGKLTPYVFYSKVTQDSPRGVTLGLPAGVLAGTAVALTKAGLQSTTGVGVRWDFHKSAGFKFQFDHVAPKDGPGSLLKPAAGFKGPVNVYAAGIDFVF